MTRNLDFIVAMTEKRVIGNGGALPWHLPDDLKRFRRITLGHTVIMGRKTYASIGKPLPGRKNIVLSRASDLKIEGVTVCTDWDAVERNRDDQAFVIGGSEIFQSALPRLRRLYLTLILEDFSGDVFFPELPLRSEFVLEEQSEVITAPFRYQYQTWVHR